MIRDMSSLQAFYGALPNTDSNSEKSTSPVSPRSNDLKSTALWS